MHWSLAHSAAVGALFVWTGFVRSGLGFGGAALGLPLLLFLDPHPLAWLPIIGFHLLFFSALTLRSRLSNVDWAYLGASTRFIIPAALVGVVGLVHLPIAWLDRFIYGVSLFYGALWFLNWTIGSRRAWADKLLLLAGGYVAGTSLTGAPLMVAVFMRNVAKERLRDTLFVLWFVLVALKMATLSALGVDLHMKTAVLLLPVAAVGHWLGLKVHHRIARDERQFRRLIGAGLLVVSLLGLLA
ncbi:MAG: TSUP family transporter [Betaproteobacteria bacterium]|nr:TSUP family transporter [Betaproteobacteria bacterium]